MAAKLISLDFTPANTNLTLDHLPVVIGSSPDAGIRLDDPYVSPQHCRLEVVDGRLMIHDLESVHGTFVNGHRVDEVVLRPGDELAIGMMSFYLRGSPDAEEPSRQSESELHETGMLV